MDVILVLNAGSSSSKFQIFAIGQTGLERQVKGQVDGIGVHPRFRAADAAGAMLIDEWPELQAIPDLPAATRSLKVWLRGLSSYSLRAVGHRVVHGGPGYAAPVRIDEVVLERLRALIGASSASPAQQPSPDPTGARACSRFATSCVFRHGLSPQPSGGGRLLGNSPCPHDEGVRRYGFHGLSYDYVSQRLREIAPEIAKGRVIVAHLGSGASMCALKAGQSVDSTMGFTALDGLDGNATGANRSRRGALSDRPEGDDSGRSVEPSLQGLGMKGLSGVSNDMRDLLASDDPRAVFAIDYFVQRCAVNIGGLAAAMDGMDALVFTAGIGGTRLKSAPVSLTGWPGLGRLSMSRPMPSRPR